MQTLVKISIALACLALVLGAWVVMAEEKADEELDLSTIMKKAHKEGLLKKVLSQKASQEDKDQLVEYYVAMSKLEPPEGDMASWKKLNDQILSAAKAVQGGRGNLAQLNKVTNCKACHNVHK
jgi:hypothetical protein